MKKKGISLILLIITIIVVIIIAGVVILNLGDTGVLDQSKKAKFMSDYRVVQEGVNLYSLSKYDAVNQKFDLPLKGYLTEGDKTYITDNVPTLNTKIEELSGSITAANLAWISSEDINVKLSSTKQEKGYILDVTTGQIYDYVGDYFEGKRWHTLDGGVLSDGSIAEPVTVVSQELWDGWIKLTLYYPAGSTDKKWRLGTEGELRVDPMLMWQDYTGTITIPLDRVKDVWIKYKIDNVEYTIPPVGTLLVDIVPDKTGTTKVDKVNVTINFDVDATTKEYRVGDSGWITYTGQFVVTENCIVEARAKKTETIYNVDGSILATRDVAGKDLVYIGNIGIDIAQILDNNLAAPTITRLAPVGSEKARVQIVYPIEADGKIYKVNLGIEENYTTEINVTSYGTYIIAYYYDAAGKRSNASSIRINDTNISVAELSTPYDPKPPYEPGNPPPPYDSLPVNSNDPNDPSNIVAPTVNVSPSTLAEEVQVSINSPANADKVYIKLGRYAQYQEYTSAITVRKNMEVYAYYRTYTGEKSATGYGVVRNIKKNNKPYVYIDANPYPWSSSYGASDVTITISYSDTNTIEYSEDGIVYIPYTAPFKVTENKRIYARATNDYGVTETSLNITNIGKLITPKPSTNLAVNINVNPEPALSTTRVAKATITIDYDVKATEKYYSIGRYGTLQTYSGAFDVTSNCTVYAYAKGLDSEGQVSKTIDNLSNGISQPIITALPSNKEQASKVTVSIQYDKYSTIKNYSIDGSTLRNYTGQIEITKNGTVIYAYSQNELGQKAEASYTIENIVPEPPTLLIDKGNYYILKLNYPPASKGKEYKWKVDGVWDSYKDAGILLIKPQFKDQLIQNGSLIKIEDESGNMITFTGDYYLIDVPISELFENLFMRWDREPLSAPQILITPTEPTMQVTANIVYNSALITKQYKIIKPGEISSSWIDYTGPITIDKNNTVIYARGMDETEVWSAEGMLKVINIDENAPVIKLTADLIAAQQKVFVKVNVTDDVEVGKVKWIAGIQGESYFVNSGAEIPNDSIVNITSNGYYTFYAEDKVGNKQVYTLNVTNVDLTPPVIDIAISPENTVGLIADVTINYGDSTIKQYKIGTSNAVWINYTAPFVLSSYTILANNWQNADGTVTIYAKGKDAVGNEIIVEKKVVSLDLDRPIAPVINSSSGYATLYEYGTKFDAVTSITFDSRSDIDNYYSIDLGVTWLPYIGQFDMSNGTVIAKSVKKSTGLEIVISKTITMPADALKLAAYDGNDTTYINLTNQYMIVDPSMQGRNIRVKCLAYYEYGYYNYYIYIRFLDENKQEISVVTKHMGSFDETYVVPANTKWIKYESNYSGNKLYEINTSNEPKFDITNGYMTLTANQTKAIKEPYQMIAISYYSTSVQRLYKIEATGEWLNYNDQAVKINQGQTIYAKGIDQYGNETRLITSYTANVVDALKPDAYDGNDTTYTSVSNQYILVDPSMQGKSIRVKWFGYYAYGLYDYYVSLTFLNENMQEISVVSRKMGTFDDIYTVPINTKWIKYYSNYGTNKLYEIDTSNEPNFNITDGYMTLNADPTKAIKEPYQMVAISYFSTSVQRLYKIEATGEWLNYNDQSVKVKQGQTIYAKGIDQYGNETRLITSYTANVVDALKPEAFDGNDTTYTSIANQYMLVDPSMQGKSIRVKWFGYYAYGLYDYYVSLTFLDENKQEISVVSRKMGTFDDIYTVPINTKWIKYYSNYATNKLYEINISSIPSFSINPTSWTNGNVTVSLLTLSTIDTAKYSFDSTNWFTYTDPLTVTTNSTTVYAKSVDTLGVESAVRTLTVANIDKILPTVAYGTNGKINVKTASTTVTVNDTGGSTVNTSTLQYVWDTQNTTEPSSGWATFTNGATLTKGSLDATYYLWIKGSDNAGNSIVSKTNAFVLDNTIPDVPTISASPTGWTNGNVLVTITYPADVTTKQYSTNGTTWSTYTIPVSVTVNNTTVYGRGLDAAGNISNQITLTVANIDKVIPTVAYGTNGATGVPTVDTTVTASDTGGSLLNTSTLQYVWDTQNVTTPISGWTAFTNGDTITKTNVVGPYYLWVKASDNVGNIITTKSNIFTLIENVAITSTIQTENTTIDGQTSSYNNPIIPAGFVAVNTADANWSNVSTDWDKGLVIQDTSGNQFVWIPVDGTSATYAKWCTLGYAYNNVNISDDTFATGFDVNNITTTYKGFYIARYESMFDYNGGSMRVASKKSSNKTSAVNWGATRNATYNGYLWNYINYTDSKSYSEAMTSSYGYDTTKIGTNLVTGAQWDTVMKWIQNSGTSLTDSRAWGNYSNSISPANATGSGTLQISGYSDTWREKNIYDLAGNAWEWTSEKYSTNFVARSGKYNYSGATYPPTYRIGLASTYVDYSVGFRVALYIK